jgi:hypothetical protein
MRTARGTDQGGSVAVGESAQIVDRRHFERDWPRYAIREEEQARHPLLEAHGDPVLRERPHVLPQRMVEFALPLAAKELYDRRTAGQELGPAGPLRGLGASFARARARYEHRSVTSADLSRTRG